MFTLCFIGLDHSFSGCFQITHKKPLNIQILHCSLVSVLALKWNSCKKYVNYEVSTLNQTHNGQIRQCRKLRQVYYSLICQTMLDFKTTQSTETQNKSFSISSCNWYDLYSICKARFLFFAENCGALLSYFFVWVLC